MRRIINALSRIYCGPEVKFFRDFYGEYMDDPLDHIRFITSARTMLPESQILSVLGKAFVTMHELAAQNHGKPRWADKCPENVLYLHQWQQILGDKWQFVHVVRNPLDVVASMVEAAFSLTIPASLEARISFYCRYAEAGLEFAERYPARCYRIGYEALVSNPHKEIDQLMMWLGDGYEPAQLAFNSAITHQTGLEEPKVVVSDCIHDRSINRWREQLSAEEIHLVQERTAPVWERLCATFNSRS